MTPQQQIFRVRRQYNQWVANQTLEDYSLRFTAKAARRWSLGRVAITALGGITFLALEAIGGAITLSYGFDHTLVATLLVSLIIFLTAIPISYYAASYGVDIDLLTRGAGFGYIGSTVTSLIYASFTFIFLAIEATIMAKALEMMFAVPVSIGYFISAFVVIPVVIYGFTFISRFQMFSQPLWIVLQLLPLFYVVAEGGDSLQSWLDYRGSQTTHDGFDYLLLGAAATVVISLIAQIGEQVDYLRFLPERSAGNRLRWWSMLLVAGPGWVLVGAVKLLIGSFLAVLVLQSGGLLSEAHEPTQMYMTAFGHVTGSPQLALLLAGLFVILSQVKINVTNAYAGSLAWSNFFSRLTHIHPGRVVWLVFNVTIAWLLMELGIYEAFERILGLFSILVVAWVGSLVADLVINKPLGLSPRGIEFKRAHLFDINPVGVGSMAISSVVGTLCMLGVLGEAAQAFAPFVALALTFVLAPAIALATGSRFYIAREPQSASGTRCSICEHHFEADDMTFCPLYDGNICSLCCSLDARCNDACKNNSTFSDQISALLRRLLPATLTRKVNARMGHFIGLMLVFDTIVGAFLSLIYFQMLSSHAGSSELVAVVLFKVFFLLQIVIGVAAWLFLLAHQSRVLAQDESAQQTERLMAEIHAHELTDRELQDAKELAEAASLAKSRYLTGISHELRTPLNAVLGYAQLLDAATDIPSHRRTAINVIKRSSEHLANLIEELLDISRIEAGRLELYRNEVALVGFMDQLVYMFRLQAEAKGISFNYDCLSRVPEFVATDEKRLRQILINLLSNAIKFTDRGSVSLSLIYRNEVAQFVIRDTGVGIAAGDIEKIFKPFERLDSGAAPRPGTGLGLTITQLLTDIMGGDLQVESVPGEGSVFRLTLMLASLSKTTLLPVVRQRLQGYRGPRRTVMVVDDDPTHRELVSDILQPVGFRVIAAQNGTECLQLCTQQRPDLYILDVSMPGMSGWELLDQLRGSGVQTPVVMLSADAREWAELNDNHPCDAYMVKPVRVAELLDRIGSLLALEWVGEDEQPAAVATAVPRGEPPALDLSSLRRYIELGYLEGIKNELNSICSEAGLSAGAASELRMMVQSFQFAGILERLESLTNPDGIVHECQSTRS
ncbi:hybrid sensor histidine kinase/response regulator [Marinobacterium nitratireducens]|uniref:histidine kinase n=1 Tax=Marinobacterium nitratireducens TaxID=518897 RepID=A0A918DZ51_9GAMM|nr:ATP-binding protein [Marinobacterium nitratireducens]GGO89253.1 hybrid sensor histidine kinase/response regulator [Marinobacterium nitratireducens]